MIGLISRVFLGIELVVLVLLTAALAVVMAFGVMGIGNLAGVLYFAAFSMVCLALLATADITFRRIRSDQAQIPEYWLRVGIAFGGAVVATSLTIYGRFFLSENERWSQGIDFISLGCFLWLPLLHLVALDIAHLSANRLKI